MAQWGKLSYAQKYCLGRTGKLMHRTNMIRPGARIGAAVSGGVDSWLMLQILLLRRRIVPFDFEVMALHVNPGFDPKNHAPLDKWLKKAGVSGHIEVSDFGPRAHSPENREKSPCFYCALLRRNRLFFLCKKYRLTHLAFAHTVDDLAATFFMNLFQTGKVQGMSAAEDFFKGALKVIRPILFLEKKTVAKAARDFGLPVWENPCPSSGSTRRARIEEWLGEKWAFDKRIKQNIFNALRRRQLDLTQRRD